MTADDVRTAIERPGQILNTGLAAALAEVGWRRLRPVGVSEENYSTMRALLGDPSPRCVLVTRVPIPGSDALIQLEMFPDGIPAAYSDLGMKAARAGPERISRALSSGLRELATVPAALAPVERLARSLHALNVDDPQMDVSYSDPEVPFSVFLGIHEREVPDEPLRLAEAVLHETMHLQLSLIEDVVPLVSGATERWSSPWQGRPRPAQGVLHGLYVFRAVEEFLRARRAGGLDGADDRYVERRLRTIAEEIAEAAAVVGSADLTDAGRALASRLVAARSDA